MSADELAQSTSEWPGKREKRTSERQWNLLRKLLHDSKEGGNEDVPGYGSKEDEEQGKAKGGPEIVQSLMNNFLKGSNLPRSNVLGQLLSEDSPWPSGFRRMEDGSLGAHGRVL
eukprot:scaffold160540_cov17-Tisochrysis_lutea.AAC.1